jgi:CDP-glycerol glycerophosphotransferase
MVKLFNKRVKQVLKRKIDKKYEFQYLRFSKEKKINKNVILIESTHGRDFSGHVFYLTKYLANNFEEFQLKIAIQKEKKEWIKQLLDGNVKWSNIELIEYNSKEYVYNLATAEFLVNDTTFWSYFNKRPEQMYINIWHGTPLKCLGKAMEVDGFGNVQKNFMASNVLVVSNEYTKERIVEDYNLNNIANTKVVVAPSPRNSVLFDEQKRQEVRNKVGISNEKTYFYMPTYRDVGTSVAFIEEVLESFEEKLDDDERLYIKLHPFDAEKLTVKLDDFKKVFLFPENIETYEFLTAVDVLITDYSSIMYDFLCTGKKIVLFTYDKEEYYLNRGLYEDIDDYPFKQVKTINELIEECKTEEVTNNNSQNTSFKERFISKDSINGTEQLASFLFREEKNEIIDEYSLRNNKKNVVMYAGGLWDNGISRAFFNTIDAIDLSENNYILFVKDRSVKKEHKYKLAELKIPYILSSGVTQYSLFEGILTYLYLNTEWFGKSIAKNTIEKIIYKMYRLDFRRMFNNLDIDQFIHYTGFERAIATMLSAISKSKIRTTIFYHTDMFEEYKAKKNVNMKALRSTYELVDQLVLVNSELKERILENYPGLDNIYVMDNFLGYKEIREASNESIFTSLLNVPLQYGYSEQVSDKIKKDLNIRNQIENTGYRKMFNIVKSHELGVSGLFPYVEEKSDVLLNDFKKASQLHLGTKESIDFSLNEIGYIYGVTKLRLIDDLLNPNIKVFINIGRFDIQKGHDRLIESFVEVNKKYPDTRLVIVAPHGPLKKQTISKVRESGIKEKIIILGGMDNPYSLLRLCDAFVFTSLYEGLGLVVFEALAVGTDVITVDIPATTQFLKAGSSAELPALILKNDLESLIEGWLFYMEGHPIQGRYDFEKQEKQSLDVWKTLIS